MKSVLVVNPIGGGEIKSLKNIIAHIDTTHPTECCRHFTSLDIQERWIRRHVSNFDSSNVGGSFGTLLCRPEPVPLWQV